MTWSTFTLVPPPTARARATWRGLEAERRQKDDDSQPDNLRHAAEVGRGLAIQREELQHVCKAHGRGEDSSLAPEQDAFENSEYESGEAHHHRDADPTEIHKSLGNEPRADGDVVEIFRAA